MAALVAWVLFALVVVLLVVIWSIKKHRDPHLNIRTDAPLGELVGSLAGLTHGAVLEGNSVAIFENGAFFDALLDEIASAQRSVHFETFLWKDGVLGRRVASALCGRAKAGLVVRVLVDGNGGKEMGEDVKRQLIDAGCKFKLFHQRRLPNLGVLNERDHRKLVVIDGQAAFVGGHCIVDSWLGEAQDGEHFRDLSVRLRGPIVHAAQSAFSENWVEETGELFVGDAAFPKLEKAGHVAVHIAWVKPEGSPPAVKILHHTAISCARKRIRVQNPYFLPEPDAMEALAQAVRRGVDVRVMMPSAEASDFPIVQHAAHRNFERLLASGVRIFEYEKTLLHQKVMTVDGIWSAIGSSNFDDRSFEINDEITLGFRDAGLARELEEIFERDCAECREVTREQWARRTLWHKGKDNAFYLLNEML